MIERYIYHFLDSLQGGRAYPESLKSVTLRVRTTISGT